MMVLLPSIPVASAPANITHNSFRWHVGGNDASFLFVRVLRQRASPLASFGQTMTEITVSPLG